MARLAHISDLHFGRTDARIVAHLADDLRAHRPDVVVVSGDLTQRARPHELRAARAFLDSLPFSCVVVPGNHDIAPVRAPIERALNPWRRFDAVLGDLPSTALTDDGVAVIGLNTVDPWRFIEGGVSEADIAHMIEEAKRPARFRVVVAHHPLLETPSKRLRARVRRHTTLSHVLDDARIDLVLSGHLHESFSGPALARASGHHHVLAVQASTSTSTRLRGHKNAWNLITIDPERRRVHIEVRMSTHGPFSVGAVADWMRAGGEWHAHVERGANLVETIEDPAASL